MGIGSSGVVNCANTYLGTANYTVADGYVADRTPIVGGNGPAQLNLNFARDEVLDPRITFSRTSNATRVNAQGLIEYAPHNLLTYSENFDNAVWAKTNATVTANSIVAPDGTTTGDTVLAVATGGDTGVRYTTTQTSSTVYTASIYAKYTNTRYLVIRNLAIGATLGEQWTFFDLLNGTVGTKPASVTAVITPVGGGWYRCSVSATTLATIINNFLDYRLSTTDNAYSVLDTSTINIWGAQLNIGSLQPYYTTSVKNLLGYSQNFENAAWTKSNSSVLTNLLTYSQEFDNAVWVKAAVSVSANQRVSPDGTISMDTITLTGGAGYLQQAVGTTNAVVYTLSIFIYAASNKTRLIAHNGTIDICNITWSSISSNTNTITGTATNVTSTLVGNSIYKLSFSFTASSATTNIRIQCLDASGNSVTGATGDFWGAQLVQGTNPEEYTVTTSAPAPIQVMGPLGFLGAEKLVESAVNTIHYAYQGATTSANTSHTLSVYCKAAERTQVDVRVGGLGWTVPASTVINLSNGSVISGSGTVVSVGSGWYRISITGVTDGTIVSRGILIAPASGGTATYTGDGTSGIYIFGAQLSDSASLDPYSYNFGAAPTSSAYYGPRFDYDPVTLAPKGLLIEEARTNLVKASENLSAVTWNKTGTPVLDAAIQDPSGNINTVYYPTVSEIYQIFDGAGVGTISLSFFGKKT